MVWHKSKVYYKHFLVNRPTIFILNTEFDPVLMYFFFLSEGRNVAVFNNRKKCFYYIILFVSF